MKNKILLTLVFIFGSPIFSQVDYYSQIEPIFTNANCANGYCHGNGTSGLYLDSYDGLMAGGNHGLSVIPGDAENSILVQKISPDPPFGDRMPYGNPTYFDSHMDEFQLIVDWINEGANETPLSISDQYISSPERIDFLHNYPNPFNPSTTLSWMQEKPEKLDLYVYTLPGQLVEHITLGEYSGGYHQFVWQPKKLSSGVYMIQLAGKEFLATQKVIYSK